MRCTSPIFPLATAYFMFALSARAFPRPLQSASYTVVNVGGISVSTSPTTIYETVTETSTPTSTAETTVRTTVTETPSATPVPVAPSVTTDTVTMAGSTLVVPVYPYPTPSTTFKIMHTGYSSVTCTNTTTSATVSTPSTINGYSTSMHNWNHTRPHISSYATGTGATVAYTGSIDSKLHKRMIATGTLHGYARMAAPTDGPRWLNQTNDY